MDSGLFVFIPDRYVMAELRGKQKLFCDEYLIDLNATQAAIRAGYSAKTAGQMGDENLKKPQIKEYLESRMKDREKRTEIGADYVLKRLVEIDAMDVTDIMEDDGSLRPLSAWPKVWRQSLSGMDIAEMFGGKGDERTVAGVMKKIKWPEKLKTLELLGKHVNIGAFRDQVKNEHSFIGADGKPLSMKVNICFVAPEPKG